MPSETSDNQGGTSGVPGLSRRKKIVFRIVALLLVYMSAEAIAWVAAQAQVTDGIRGLRTRLLAIASSNSNYAEVAPKFEVIHPYLGYVMHVNNPDYRVQGTQRFSVTDFGFYDAASPIRKRSPDKLIVGITGGSVAHQFSVLSSEEFSLALANRFPAREIVFVRLALCGFKQPQQLMSLNYVLSLGGEFDVVINIDGFNEIALPGPENVAFDVFAAFPRSWHLRTVTGNDTQALRKIGYIAYCREQRRELAVQFTPWRWSPIALLTWSFRNSLIEQRTLQGQKDLHAMKDLRHRFCSSGPSETFESDDEMYARLARIWADSSLQMHRLCDSNGIEYYHFLQPSPDYHPQDESDQSDESAVDGIAVSVRRGYPMLQVHGENLQDLGVRNFDMTDVFNGFDGLAFIDRIHFNKRANDHFAQRIGAHIVAHATTAPVGRNEK
jgi:hypothetical protein